MTSAPRSTKTQAMSPKVRDGGNPVAMRSITFRVPDTREAAFCAEARRQSALVAASPGEADDQAFIDSVSILHVE